MNQEDNHDHILRSRYHIDYPISVVNPLTKQTIIGEIEFYLVSIEEIMRASENKDHIKAFFIGTDLNYAYNQ